MSSRALLWVVPLLPVLALAGCGGSGKQSSPSSPASNTPTTTAAAPAAPPKTTTTQAPPSPNALQAEATSAAAGDIPDNQVFIKFQNATAGYSMKYPEGWAQQGTGAKVTFRDKNNIVRVIVSSSAPLSAARIRRELAVLRGAQLRRTPQALTIGGARAFKVVYSTQSAPNSVTGKRVTLVVDRYYLARAGKEAVVDLGTPQGVDNVDAYRLMIESFRWK